MPEWTEQAVHCKVHIPVTCDHAMVCEVCECHPQALADILLLPVAPGMTGFEIVGGSQQGGSEDSTIITDARDGLDGHNMAGEAVDWVVRAAFPQFWDERQCAVDAQRPDRWPPFIDCLFGGAGPFGEFIDAETAPSAFSKLFARCLKNGAFRGRAPFWPLPSLLRFRLRHAVHPSESASLRIGR